VWCCPPPRISTRTDTSHETEAGAARSMPPATPALWRDRRSGLYATGEKLVRWLSASWRPRRWTIVENPKRVDGQGFTAFPTTRRRTHYEHTAPTRFQITTWLRHAVTFDGPSVAAKACGTRAQSCQEIHLYTTSRVGGSHSFGGEFSGCCHRRDQRRQELPR